MTFDVRHPSPGAQLRPLWVSPHRPWMEAGGKNHCCAKREASRDRATAPHDVRCKMTVADEVLAAIRREAAACIRCPLYRVATQTVFGKALVVLAGAQPGDHEDTQGRPFVGSAGRVLDEALGRAGIGRSRICVTNAVKHFKSVPRGKAAPAPTPQRG